jgi:hypothetical protein
MPLSAHMPMSPLAPGAAGCVELTPPPGWGLGSVSVASGLHDSVWLRCDRAGNRVCITAWPDGLVPLPGRSVIARFRSSASRFTQMVSPRHVMWGAPQKQTTVRYPGTGKATWSSANT